MGHLQAFVHPQTAGVGYLWPPPQRQGGGLEGQGSRGGCPVAPARPGPPLLGDALGQLGARGRGVGREDAVAGAGGVHGQACGGADSRGAEGRGHGERGQQQQLLGHRPARGAVTAGPRRAAAGRGSDRGGGDARGPGCGRRRAARHRGGGSETLTLLVPKPTRAPAEPAFAATAAAAAASRDPEGRPPPPPGIRETERRRLERPPSRHLG